MISTVGKAQIAISQDGTAISYQTLGAGEGVIVLGGAWRIVVRGAGGAPAALERMPLWYVKLMLRLFISEREWRRIDPLLEAGTNRWRRWTSPPLTATEPSPRAPSCSVAASAGRTSRALGSTC